MTFRTTRRNLVKGGLAAGVGAAAAAAAVVILFGPINDGEGPAPVNALADADQPVANAAAWEPATGLAQVPSETDLRRVNAYMVHHARQTSLANGAPAMPFVKVLAASGDSDLDQEPR